MTICGTVSHIVIKDLSEDEAINFLDHKCANESEIGC